MTISKHTSTSSMSRRTLANTLRALRAGTATNPGAVLEALAGRCPDHRRVLQMGARHLLSEHDLDAAEQLLQDGLDRWPRNPSLLLLLAECRFLNEDAPGARAAIASALIRRPHHEATLTMAGRIATADGDVLAADALVRRARAA